MKNTTLKNNPITRGFVKLLSAVALLSVLSGTAYATPIVGEIGYSGAVLNLLGGGPTVGTASTGYTLGTATGLDFAGAGFVSIGTGDFSGLTGSLIALSDFMFAPLNPNPALVWTGGGFSFSLDAINTVTQSDSPGALYLAGSGVFSGGPGLDDTDGNWTLTAQNAPGGTIVTFSATSAVPEPGMIALIGLSLLGLGLTGRAKRVIVARS